ncbi:MAG: ankyrin repeat domain-containing protein [Alphaproteobacteria bacterium]
MFDAFFRKRRAVKEAEELEEIQARDAEAGVPTQKNLQDRFDKAAREGKWSIVDDCVQKGCSYSDDVRVEDSHNNGRGFDPYIKMSGKSIDFICHEFLPLASIALMQKDVEGLRFVLSRGAPPDWPHQHVIFQTRRYTPLHLAVHYGLPEAVKLLCDHGVDLGDKEPLQKAEAANQIEIVKIIRAEEARRNSAPPATTAEVAEARILNELKGLVSGDRDKVLWKLRAAFEDVKETATVTQGDLRVRKPITLKTGARAATTP